MERSGIFLNIKDELWPDGIGVDPLPDVSRLRFHSGREGFINNSPQIYQRLVVLRSYEDTVDFSKLPKFEQTGEFDQAKYMDRTTFWIYIAMYLYGFPLLIWAAYFDKNPSKTSLKASKIGLLILFFTLIYFIANTV